MAGLKASSTWCGHRHLAKRWKGIEDRIGILLRKAPGRLPWALESLLFVMILNSTIGSFNSQPPYHRESLLRVFLPTYLHLNLSVLNRFIIRLEHLLFFTRENLAYPLFIRIFRQLPAQSIIDFIFNLTFGVFWWHEEAINKLAAALLLSIEWSVSNSAAALF